MALVASLASITQEMLISLAPKREPKTSVMSHDSMQAWLTLRDHLQIDIIVSKCRKHAPRDANHVLHVRSDQTQDGHARQHADISTLLQVLRGRLECFRSNAVSVDGQRHMHLTRRDEVHRDGLLVEDGEDSRKEAMGDGSLVRVHVDDADLILDRDGGWALGILEQSHLRGSRSVELLSG